MVTDWPISDHMIGTSHRGPIQRLVSRCVRRERAQLENAGTIYEQQPAPTPLPSNRLCTWAGQEVV
ncbi:unnamed protein product, partial [Staurois parvus]